MKNKDLEAPFKCEICLHSFDGCERTENSEADICEACYNEEENE